MIYCITHSYMFVPTNVTVKLANGTMIHAQVIGIILCHFPNFPIIYLVGPFCYFPVHPYNTISLVPSNFMFAFKRLPLNLLNIVIFLTLKVILVDHPTKLKTIYTIFKLKFSKSTLKEIGILWSQPYVTYKNIISFGLFISAFVMYWFPG